MSRKTPDSPESERGVQGVALLYKAFRVLDAVAAARNAPRIGELLIATRLSKGTLYRLLQALVDRRYLRVDPAEQSYHLGTRLFDLAHSVWESFDLRAAAAPELIDLRDRLGETTRLSVLDGYHVLCIDQQDAFSELRVASGIGNRVPAHASSAGKAMLSALEPVHKAQVLSRLSYDPLTPATIGDEAALRDHLDLVSAKGYALSIEERLAGISSVAAAILDANSRPVGALGVTGPAFRLGLDRLNAIGRDLILAARRISGNAGIYTQPFSVSTPRRPEVPVPGGVECVLEAQPLQGEGPLWSATRQMLYWVDILGPALHVFDPRRGSDRSIPFPFMLSALAETADGNLAVATRRGVQLFDLSTSRLTPLIDPESALASNRLNDAKVDRRGRLWVGSMAIDGSPGHGSLYRIDGRGRATTVDSGFAISNGIAWSPDDRFLYFIDSGVNRVYRYAFDIDSGAVGERSTFISFPEDSGRPGGMTVDAEGFLWIAHYDGWAVSRFAPDGRLDRSIPLPVPRPTSCTFGGDGLRDLYVTSARIRLSAERISEAPRSGSVFRIRPGVRGLPEPAFALAARPQPAAPGRAGPAGDPA